MIYVSYQLSEDRRDCFSRDSTADSSHFCEESCRITKNILFSYVGVRYVVQAVLEPIAERRYGL